MKNNLKAFASVVSMSMGKLPNPVVTFPLSFAYIKKYRANFFNTEQKLCPYTSQSRLESKDLLHSYLL